ncbi:carbamoyl-phosphate synthase (glutamine-hydrolyzing) cpa2 [Tyrophagus putrescentiae]|nr:carbamoyl-phosphate synthase (glutamine-hydrolyzing) cpa2 [Tyrophagus putrescentiae]
MHFYLLCFLAALLPTLCLTGNFTRNDQRPVDFSRHMVIRIQPSNIKHIKQLKKLELEYEMDFWNPVMPNMRPVLTVIDPPRSQFITALNNSQIGYEVVHQNLKQVVDQERQEMVMASKNRRDLKFDYENQYHTYEEIIQQIKHLATTYPAKATYINVGTSYEGREIPALAIGSGSKVVFLECGSHSREWVTIAFGTWVSNALINDASHSALLSTYKFIVVPVLNVDGFVYTHTIDRVWRKTRSKTEELYCKGVDLNRNWATSFCTEGASTHPCLENYCGKSAFSEAEAKQLSELVNQFKAQAVAYFAIHSYSQKWMYPYGYKTALPANAAKLKEISQAGIAAIKAVNNLTFIEGPHATAIYIVSGSSIDWAYEAAGIQASFLLEMRDEGQFGFLLPANQIKPACLETWAGIKAALSKI